MKIVAIIQARMSSTRLPGKILLPLVGEKTALECMLERVKKSKLIDKIVIATTTSPADKKLIDFLKKINQPYFAGSENDVLARYNETAKKFCKKGDIIVRLTSDCQVIDSVITDKVISYYLENNFDFASNTLEPYSFPDGMDTEVFSYENLKRAAEEAILPSHREHVTFYFWQNPEKFKIGYLKNDKNLSSYRLTLDYSSDYELLKRIYEHFAPSFDFSMADIVKLMDDKPELKNLNSDAVRNTGWQSALEEDKKVKK